MTLDTMHRLMLPSDRTLQIMAAVDLPQDEGNYKIAPRAPFGHTIHCMVFSVLVHLCLWIGCDVRFPARGPCFRGRWAIIALMALQQLNGRLSGMGDLRRGYFSGNSILALSPFLGIHLPAADALPSGACPDRQTTFASGFGYALFGTRPLLLQASWSAAWGQVHGWI
eukprot:Skav212060  [mRNA]  locus=scaffold408:177403:177906:+ [translate_table: standard]